jgi:peptidoglycan hydrolase CwlO-like protein
LSTPIFTSSGDVDKALVLLSSESSRSWTAAAQNYLADIAQSLGRIFELKARNQIFEAKFSELNNALGNLQTENEHLLGQLADLTSNKKDSTQQLHQLQSKLDQARREIAALKEKTSVDREKEGSPK